MNHLPRWHARVAAATRGSGFLIDDRHVLTCAHVVGDRPAATVSFLALGRDHSVPGTVVYRGPWTPGAGEGDVAVVRLDELVGLEPARLAPLHAVEIFAEQKLAAFGFPSGYTGSGQISYFRADPHPRLAGRACQTTPVDDTGFVLREGYSGSAAYVCGTDEVIGMVISADRDGTSGSGVILPVDELHRQWPQLAERIPLGPFGPAPYRELRDILHDVHLPEAHALLLDVLAGHPAPPAPRRRLPSVLAVAEFLAVITTYTDEQVRDLVVGLLREVGKRVPERREALHGWTGQHGWGTDRTPAAVALADEPARQGWVVVRIAPTGGSRRLCHLTIWTATGPDGELDEPVLDEEVPRAKVRAAVERSLPGAYARLPLSCETIGVEFVLPRGLLGWEVDTWAGGLDVPLGWQGPVVVRDLEWFDSPAPHEIEKRARRLRDDPGTLDTMMRWLECSTPTLEPQKFQAWLWVNPPPVALGLAGPWAADQHIHRAVASGVPALLWRRAACDVHIEATTACAGTRFRAEMVERLRGLRGDDLPTQIRDLRAEAGLSDDPEHCGRDVTLLWDEPRRRPAALGFAE
ncbi:trypsin-like peptidase domain-containing protein [Micromonospora sp. MS34]|uniref:VMAP-C domain-containing protein n=1 Tax=Micromonospora sp. MS34 TaxID=3385971 RepID=UPI0039A2EE3E